MAIAKANSKENAKKHLFAHLSSTSRKYASFSASVCKLSWHQESAPGAKSRNQELNIRATEPWGVTNTRAPNNQKSGKTDGGGGVSLIQPFIEFGGRTY